MLDEQKHDPKHFIMEAIEARSGEMGEIALKIHANPELSFQEHKAVDWLTTPLLQSGFQVETGIANLETAFRATWEGKPDGPTIALLAEYDALPGIGHACGHNLIGTAAVGAALALKDACPKLPGRIVVLGTPAEEEGGGKIMMCQEGVFDNIDAVMLCHPHRKTIVLRGGLACVDTTFRFFGKQSHASSAPEHGISALDALINSFVAINSLRQFFKESIKIHGIISKGGDAPNIVPDYCEAKFMFRASTVKELDGVREKLYTAVRHSTEAVGARLEISEGLVYAERNNNMELAMMFKRNLELMGIEVSDPPKNGGIGSSDIGNVGQVTAAIHPYIELDDFSAHTPEFCEAAGSEKGLKALNLATKALAMTAYDLCVDSESLRMVRQEFENWKQKQNEGVL